MATTLTMPSPRWQKTSSEFHSDVDFGHIDWRIDHALGQFRRALQSRLSSEDFRPELLDHYGTFLPTEKRHSYRAALPDALKIKPSSCLKRKRERSTEEVDFGHIDRRIDDVLGRFRRAFQCRLQSKTLCLKLDKFGTFLPANDWNCYAETPPDASKLVSPTCLERKREREESSKEDEYHGKNYEHECTEKRNITSTGLGKSSGEVEHMDAVGDVEHAPILRDVSGESDNEYILAESSLKEATKLKRAADHLKKAGDDTEIDEIYIHSGIKFLKGAFLLDHCRPKEVDRRIHIYKSAASLFEYCASAYKRKGHTQAAALAYKCMEVAKFRINQDALGKHIMKNASGDTQNTPGLNQPVQIGIHMDLAMSATRRYRGRLEACRKCFSPKAGCTAEGHSAVEKALNFNFHDVDGFLDLVKLALKEIVP